MTEKLKHWCRGKETGTGASSGRRVHTHRESRPNQREIVQRRDTEHEANTFHEKKMQRHTVTDTSIDNRRQQEVNTNEESKNQEDN